MKISVLRSIGTMSGVAAVMAVAAMVPATTVLAGGDGVECEEIEATINSVADLAAFTTEGVIKGDLKGTTEFTGDAASLAPVTSAVYPPLEPLTFSYVGELRIMTKKGTLVTQGVGVFEGIPGGVGTQFDHVVDGTGKFEGATGTLYANFESDGDTGETFTSTVTGVLCYPDGDDYDDDDDDD